MKFKIVLPIMLLLAFTLHLQAQNSDEKGNNENKKEVAKQANKRANQNKNSQQDKNKEKDWSDDHGYNQDDDDSYKKDKEKRTKKNKKSNKVKSNNGQGNAFGKNKNGLEGREFGQERARQARLQNQKRYQTLQQTLVVTQNRIPTLRERIDNAKTLLQKQRPTLSVEVYQTKNRKLEEAERKMTSLEQMVVIAREFEKN